MKGFRGRQEEVLSIETFDGYKLETKGRIDERERQALRNKVKEDNKYLKMYGGVEGIYWSENVFARPNGLREKAETAISCRGPGPARKKKEILRSIYQ